MNRRRSRATLTTAIAVFIFGACLASGQTVFASSPRVNAGDTGAQAFLLKLDPPSTTQVFDSTDSTGTTKEAAAAARTQKGRIVSAQANVAGDLPARTSVLFRTHSLMAGLAVTSDPDNLDALKDLPGVAAVYPIAPKKFDNSYAVPLQGAPAAWTNTGGLGVGVKIAIIDTGIDYTHANFGGPGTKSAYDIAHAAEASAANPALFPSAKVAGGYDLVGDSYNPDPEDPDQVNQPVPHPDPNPLDCNGHGSHVAGSAAGYGEGSDGSTYTGDYDNGTDFDSMKIGPGMAPEAKLYAYRVFGCEGSSSVISEAIDKATDPNGDGNPSDGADVINMSLGSDFGSSQDGDSMMANAAVNKGITVAVSAGNAGDVTDISGSPGNASKVITVANSQDASSRIDGTNVTIDGSPSLSGSERGELYDWTGPDLTGTVVLPPSGNQTACDPYPANTFTSNQVVLVKWTDDDLECASILRGDNLADAGAGGFIFASNSETFSAGINGSDTIPGVLMVKSGGDAIRTALEDDKVVTVEGTETNSVLQDFPDDDNKVSPSSSRGIHEAGDVKPDVTAVGTSVFSTANGTGNDGISFTGTSMAAPMVAGLAALVVQAHPDWTTLQVKADIMNTAGQDLHVNGSASDEGATYAPARVGAGRIQAEQALQNDVLAYNTANGSVSVSFGPVEVSGPTSISKNVAVVNKGTSSVTYDTSYDPVTEVPGVSYDVSPGQVTVAPGAAQNVTVTFQATGPSDLTKTVDPTIGRLGSDGNPRETLAEASGRLLLAPDSGTQPTLRVPVYSAPRPVSNMTQDPSLDVSGVQHDSVPMALTGSDLGTGTSNGSGNSDPDDDIFSIAAGFELQATSGPAPACGDPGQSRCYQLPEEKDADLKYVGFTSNAPYIANSQSPDLKRGYFAVSTQTPWSIPSDKVTFQINIDVNGDDVTDFYLYNTRTSDTDDQFVAALQDANTGDIVSAQAINDRFGDIDTALYDSDSMIMPIRLTALAAAGINASNPRINYGIISYTPFSQGVVDSIGMDDDEVDLQNPLSVDLFNPGVSATDSQGDGSTPLNLDFDGEDLLVHRNAESYDADDGHGLLMVHLHNANGNKAQVVSLHRLSQSLSITSTPGSPQVGDSYGLTANAESGAPVTFTSQTGAVCSVTGSTVTFLDVGSCTIEAGQAGNASYDAATTHQTFTVAKGETTTTVASSPSGISATVERPGRVGPYPSGTVTFSVDGAVVGTAQLANGVASGSFKVPNGAKRHLVASYPGDSRYNASTGAADRTDPTIAARVSSSRPKSRAGWYRTPVKVTFTCVANGSDLPDGCPAPVTRSGNGKGQSVAATVTAADGGSASVLVKPINVDRVKPRVKIAGVHKGRSYRKAPRGHCKANDPLSGIASCRLTKKRKGKKMTYVAKATDKAGNVTVKKVKVRL